MNHKTALLVVVACGFLLSACADVRKGLSQTKAIPDEFSVYTRAPLTMPPDYGVRPPPGGQEDNGLNANRSQQTVRRVLLENSTQRVKPVRGSTPGTTALLTLAGTQNAKPDIRQVINNESTRYAQEDKSVIESMMFWKNPVTGTIVDAGEESKRIQESQALGQPVNEGTTKMIEPKSKAPLEGLFKGIFK
ncbi:MAG: DUF3035 domain-containing protein [Magnetovibrio sp.]|nr:DUF3035 domain-containing protein [Magnetovibrio sp.]